MPSHDLCDLGDLLSADVAIYGNANVGDAGHQTMQP